MNKFQKIRKIVFPCLIVAFCVFHSNAQSIQRVDPSHWWVGMKDPKLQLLIYGKNIAKARVELAKYPGIKINSIQKVENPNYIFVNVLISPLTKPGKINILIDGKKGFEYELKTRDSYKLAKLNETDLIYLVLPDRFSNGDHTNDSFSDMADTISDRKNPWARHGGDLLGIENHIDYFKELNVTALWLNPVTENNQPQTNEGGNLRSAYHGYGFTDHYNIDKRLGGNKAYKSLIEKAHKNKIKIIQDAVYNHCGVNHWILNDLPMKSWLNQWPSYTNTSYKDQPLLDPYAAKSEVKITRDGWFVPFLPDLNQKNEFVSNYLIQNAIWQTEEFDLDAWRVDTYFYNDLEFMNKCNQALINQFPDLLIFGENWTNSIPNQAYFVQNNFNLPFKSNLESTVDFQLSFAITAALNEPYGWNNGVQKLYQCLAQDYMYKSPNRLVTFLDNHDTDRILSTLGNDPKKYKTALIWLLTLRGIPQIYYGTELNEASFKNPSDAEVRKDFMGGFTGDQINKFNKTERSKAENETIDLIAKISQFKQISPAFKSGKFTQFIPFDEGVYVYFKHSEKQTIMVVSNTSSKDKNIDFARFDEILKGKRVGFDVINQKEIEDLSKFKSLGGETYLIEIK
jgi:neopullulanase